MPCMSYDTNWAAGSNDRDVKRLKKEADKLARIACAAMSELEKMGKEDFLILKNEEVAEWWAKHKEADRKEQERVAEKERRERLKKEALDRLTDEEKEVLGLAPIKAKRVRKDVFEEDPQVVYDIDEILKHIQTIKGE